MLSVHVLPLKICSYCAHFPAGSRNHIKVLAETVPLCWDGCFTEPAFTHYSCGQAGAAGKTITPESRNATQLCGLKLDSYPFDTLSVSCRLVVDPLSLLFLFFPISTKSHSFYWNLLNMCLEHWAVCSVDSGYSTDCFINGYWAEVVSNFTLFCLKLCWPFAQIMQGGHSAPIQTFKKPRQTEIDTVVMDRVQVCVYENE